MIEKELEIVLPSGKKVVIGKPTPTQYIKIQKIVSDDKLDLTDAALQSLVMLSCNPKITIEDKVKDGEVHLDEYELEDYLVLQSKAIEFINTINESIRPFLGTTETEDTIEP
jgi:hypothetical protein